MPEINMDHIFAFVMVSLIATAVIVFVFAIVSDTKKNNACDRIGGHYDGGTCFKVDGILPINF